MEEYKKYFEKHQELLSALENLHQKKYRLKRTLRETPNVSPFVTEFSGLPRTGKSSSVDRVYNFFKQAGINIARTTEPAQIIKESMTNEEVSRMTNLEFNHKTLEISKKELNRIIAQKPEIIIQDRGVIDNYFWYQMMYEDGTIDITSFEKLLLQMYQDILNTDLLFVMLATPQVIVFRDYVNQIYLEARSKTTIERVTKLKEGFEHLLPILRSNIQTSSLVTIDTTNMTEMETAIFIADTMISGIERKLSRGGGIRNNL